MRQHTRPDMLVTGRVARDKKTVKHEYRAMLRYDTKTAEFRPDSAYAKSDPEQRPGQSEAGAPSKIALLTWRWWSAAPIPHSRRSQPSPPTAPPVHNYPTAARPACSTAACACLSPLLSLPSRACFHPTLNSVPQSTLRSPLSEALGGVNLQCRVLRGRPQLQHLAQEAGGSLHGGAPQHNLAPQPR